ncbi:MAG: KpsF/GutQ family sugar-phosphate isomerase [Pirellulales bacterium]|nr:KpsF/GutQ family sugar-phosphate isomerase [Pirellulales bacterium]
MNHALDVQQCDPLTSDQQLAYAREIIDLEAQTLMRLSGRLDERFTRAVALMRDCRGLVVTSGMGKAGDIARKITGTLTSTGTRSVFLDPAGAIHGDLGVVQQGDVVIMFSQSGETEEVVRLLPSLADAGASLIAVTAGSTSTLGGAATVTLELGAVQEACSLGLAPSTSTTAMAAIGDALALVTSRLHEFTPEQFARNHPGGSLGRKLAKVEQHMRDLTQCRVARQSQTVRDVMVVASQPGRRTGAVLLVDSKGRLTGLFTDSDLARLFEQRRDSALDGPISDVMTSEPQTVPVGARLADAMQIMAERKISELPVVSEDGSPIGVIDITDVLSLMPEDDRRELTAANKGAPPAPHFPLRAMWPEQLSSAPQPDVRD